MASVAVVAVCGGGAVVVCAVVVMVVCAVVVKVVAAVVAFSVCGGDAVGGGCSGVRGCRIRKRNEC